MEPLTQGTASQSDSSDSLRRTAQIVGIWLLGCSVLPPTGLLWQFGVLEAMGHWLVSHVLAALHIPVHKPPEGHQTAAQ